MLQRVSRWTPSSQNTTHSGAQIPHLADFFIPPPAEIGRVISADSNVSLDKPHPSPILNCLGIGIVTLFAAMLGDLLVLKTGGNNPTIGTGRVIVSIVFAVTAIVLSFKLLVVFPRCSYVGEQGIADFQQMSNSIQKIKPTIVLFKTVDSLLTRTTKNYYNGIYSGTSYEYKWGTSDRAIATLSGYFYSWNDLPHAKHYWHFINAGEFAWTTYLWNRARQQYDRQGYVEFRMSKYSGTKFQTVRVGGGWMEFRSAKGGNTRIDLSDMREMSLNNGGFSFIHKDAKWLSSQGKFYFDYASIGNAKLFLICMSEIAMKPDAVAA